MYLFFCKSTHIIIVLNHNQTKTYKMGNNSEYSCLSSKRNLNRCQSEKVINKKGGEKSDLNVTVAATENLGRTVGDKNEECSLRATVNTSSFLKKSQSAKRLGEFESGRLQRNMTKNRDLVDQSRIPGYYSSKIINSEIDGQRKDPYMIDNSVLRVHNPEPNNSFLQRSAKHGQQSKIPVSGLRKAHTMVHSSDYQTQQQTQPQLQQQPQKNGKTIQGNDQFDVTELNLPERTTGRRSHLERLSTM